MATAPTVPPLAFVLDPSGGPGGAALAAAFTARGLQGLTRATLALDFLPFDRLRALVVVAGPGGVGAQREPLLLAAGQLREGASFVVVTPPGADGDAALAELLAELRAKSPQTERLTARAVEDAEALTAQILGVPVTPVAPVAPVASEAPATSGGLAVASYTADRVSGEEKDSLGIGPDVDAFAAVILAKSVAPPLSIGLFGDWGAGKTFFMQKLERRCADIAASARLRTEAGEPSAWHSRVAQIRFNAWHYSDADLWASLVTHIFDELARRLNPGVEDIAAARAELIQRLEATKKLQDELAEEIKAAQKVSEDARKKLAEESRRAEVARKLLQKRKSERLFELVANDPRLREGLGKALTQLGVAEGEATVEQLGEVLREVKTFSGRVQALMASLLRDENKWWVVLAIFALLIGVPLLLYGLYWVMNVKLGNEPLVAMIGAALIQTWVTLSAFLGLAHQRIAKLVSAVNTVELARQHVKEALERDDATPLDTPELRAAQAELAAAEATEAAALAQLGEAEARLLETQRLLEEAQAGRRFFTFIQDRAGSEDYKKRLGLLNLIRQDFERLEALLRDYRQSAGHDDDSGVERIVLYIDDLDRCEPRRVYDVLQAVHLLLALPLFVVVVGVDARWLHSSLDKQLGEAMDGAPAGESRALNYLEKIFQIPYAIPPMDPAGYRRFISDIVGDEAERWRDATEEEPRPFLGTEAGDTPDLRAAPTPEGVPAPSPVNEDPERLRVTERELRHLQEVGVLLRTPRAAKRFVNIYRLLRAAMPRSEREALTGGAEQEIRLLLWLLALNVGQPDQGELLLNALMGPEGDVAQKLSGLCEQKRAEGDPRWAEIHDRWEKAKGAADIEEAIAVARRWGPRVGRFTFRAKI
ncbi:hypothetical protein L6R49_11250 [Myxococcota bacterium]|nr:hypothetical protein [Myxococcota bacterium]